MSKILSQNKSLIKRVGGLPKLSFCILLSIAAYFIMAVFEIETLSRIILSWEVFCLAMIILSWILFLFPHRKSNVWFSKNRMTELR